MASSPRGDTNLRPRANAHGVRGRGRPRRQARDPVRICQRGWLKSYRRRIGRQALYRRTDIEALRGVVAPERGRRGRSLPDASSWVTVAQPKNSETATSGVIVAESAVSSILEGRLAYRGYPIEEVVEHAAFE